MHMDLDSNIIDCLEIGIIVIVVLAFIEFPYILKENLKLILCNFPSVMAGDLSSKLLYKVRLLGFFSQDDFVVISFLNLNI